MSCPCLFKSVPAYAQRFLLMMIDKLREEADLLLLPASGKERERC
jgi:hypothetical protein